MESCSRILETAQEGLEKPSAPGPSQQAMDCLRTQGGLVLSPSSSSRLGVLKATSSLENHFLTSMLVSQPSQPSSPSGRGPWPVSWLLTPTSGMTSLVPTLNSYEAGVNFLSRQGWKYLSGTVARG